MDEAEQIDKEEDSAGSLVRLNEEIQDQKKMQAKVREIVKTLKETGKENKKTPAKPFGKEEFSYDKKRDVYICPEVKSAVSASILGYALPAEMGDGSCEWWNKKNLKSGLKKYTTRKKARNSINYAKKRQSYHLAI